MKNRIIIAVLLLVAIGVFFGFAEADLPGINSADENPDGCVSCHSERDGNDYRLNVSLESFGHPVVDNYVSNIPGDCGMCHADNALAKVVHKAHYSDPSDNSFVLYYDGDCLSCHTYNSGSGLMTNKTGKKNW